MSLEKKKKSVCPICLKANLVVRTEKDEEIQYLCCFKNIWYLMDSCLPGARKRGRYLNSFYVLFLFIQEGKVSSPLFSNRAMKRMLAYCLKNTEHSLIVCSMCVYTHIYVYMGLRKKMKHPFLALIWRRFNTFIIFRMCIL